MNKLKTLALAALAAFGLTAYGAGVSTNDWWNVTFEPGSFQAGFEGLTEGELGSLTNDAATMAAGTVQPYAAGVWSALDGDESYVTNGLVTNFVNGAMAEVADSVYLKLDTQGNDLTWTPADTTNGVKNIVDADLYLVGSDSEPAAGDFDSANDVQTAIYLKNELNAEGETTNSILCVYIYDTNIGSNTWQELDGVELADNAWAHVQVMVDHSGANPMVSVAVNGTPMHARGDAATAEWRAANYGDIDPCVSSVAFRGTGAVDNFVGKTVAESSSYYTFTAEAYLDNTLQTTAAALNPTVENTDEEVKTGSTTKFEGFAIDDTSLGDASYALKRIVIFAPDGTVSATFKYTYTDAATAGADSGQVTADADDSAYVAFEPDFFDDTLQGGPFSVTVPTDTATSNAVLVKVYFERIGGSATAPAVDPGDGLEAYNTAHASDPGFTPVQPIDFSSAATPLCEVSFVATEPGWYFLYTNMTVTGTYRIDVGSKQEVSADSLVTLTETGANTAKFFKIGWSATEPTTAEAEPAE